MLPTVRIRHHIPGRTRLVLSAWPAGLTADGLGEALAAVGLVLTQSNPRTCSLLVLHDHALPAETLLRDVARLVNADPVCEAPSPTKASPPSMSARPQKSRRPAANIKATEEVAEARSAPLSHDEAAHIEASAVLDKLSAPRAGLTPEEAADRQRRFGVNSAPMPPGRNLGEMLSGQILNLPTGLLIGSAVLSIATGGLIDAAVTVAVIGINAAIGYSSESATERLIHRLTKPVEHEATYLRSGRAVAGFARDAVPGDVIRLAPGTIVPADARVLLARNLTADESALTGESLPVQKYVDPCEDLSGGVGERTCILHAGTVITGGDGEAVVFATGQTTEMAQTRQMIGLARPPRPDIEIRLDRLGSRLVFVCLGVSGIVFAAGVMRGERFADMARNAIALAVAALPEGLPAIATSTLALGARAMEKDRAYVRALPAVEAVGGIDTICLDKTGTLTENRMAVVVAQTAEQRYERNEDGGWSFDTSSTEVLPLALSKLCQSLILCNEASLAETGSGSSTERALLSFAQELGHNPCKEQNASPITELHNRNDSRHYMATAHMIDAEPWVMLKGAPDQLLALCTDKFVDGTHLDLTEKDRAQILADNQELAARGLRVLGVAHRRGYLGAAGVAGSPETEGGAPDPSEQALVWLGLVAMADPIRPQARKALDYFHKAGIRTIMITGDQPATAYAVARSLEMSRTGIIEVADGARIAGLSEHDLGQLALKTSVFARVSPSDKLRIVNALQSVGRRVAMIGDGVNDGPALRAASVGVALGEKATDVAREVADIVIADDDISQLGRAIARGRATNDNVRAATHFLLATNLGEILVMLGEALHGQGESETPMELFWLNLVTDILPGLGLSLAEPRGDVMAHPPEPRDRPVLTREETVNLLMDGGGMAAATFIAHLLQLHRSGTGPKTRSLTFVTLALSQFFYAWTLRDRSAPRTESRLVSEHRLEAMLAGSLGLLVLPFVVPVLRRTLGVAPMRPRDIATALALAGGFYLFAEARRFGFIKPLTHWGPEGPVHPTSGSGAPPQLLPPAQTE